MSDSAVVLNPPAARSKVVPREETQAKLDARSRAGNLIKPADRYTVADRLEEQAARFGERDFLVYGGRWYFRRRLPCYWYATDLNKPPIGDRKMRWPGREPYQGTFHDLFPSWKDFWAERPDKDQLPEVAEPAALDRFLATLRRGAPDPRIRVR